MSPFLFLEMGWEALLYTFHHYPGAPILLFGFLFSFALSFAVGANDTANSWGACVGKIFILHFQRQDLSRFPTVNIV
jgi:hypothetical protein